MVVCPDRRQVRIALGYMRGFIESIPLIGDTVQEIQKKAIVFKSGLRVEIHTASFRSLRGYTVPFAVLDELAYFRADETSANPDSEILAALKPAMVTVPDALLVCLSTPYARRGELWKAHQKYFGREDDSVLVIKGPLALFNPSVPAHFIQEAFEQDPISAASEYGSLEEGIQFRSDIESFVLREAVENCITRNQIELAPASTIIYRVFVDPSGGSQDSFTLAISHSETDRAILDCIREIRPPFSPESVCSEFASLLKTYRISSVTGDRYAGEWPREQFRKYGIDYKCSEFTKSELYTELLPLLNSNRAELLDNPRLISQLCNLERRTARSGKDSIDHPPNAHDDLANAAAGAMCGFPHKRLVRTITGPYRTATPGVMTHCVIHNIQEE
jgi:hypothetical protein